MIPNKFNMRVNRISGLYTVVIEHKELRVSASHTNIKKAMYKAVDHMDTAYDIEIQNTSVEVE